MFNDLQINNSDSITGRARIKVIGVGGAGNNAINRMIDANIESAEFYVVNTDSQILALSLCQNRVQIGRKLTKGLGAGADPEVGKMAAEENKEELTNILNGTDLLFITAGMGGGTGTGAAPVIAKIARDMKILTVAVVTEPFGFEGRKRMDNTEKGLENLKKYVDTLIVIPNDKIRNIVPKGTPMPEALRVADEILKQGIKGITELIVNPALINLDFADVKTILKDKGIAHLGVGVAKGENRILEAVRVAVNSPLLETTIEGAKGVILNIVGGQDLAYDEVEAAAELVKSVVDSSANIIFGARIDPNVHDEVEITVIATDFPGGQNRQEPMKAHTNYNDNAQANVRRMSISQPYYAQQQPAVHQQPPVEANYVQRTQPQQPMYQQPVYQQPVQQPVQPDRQAPVQPQQPAYQQPPVRQNPAYTQRDEGEMGIERPNEKTLPKFVQRLKNLGRKRED